MSSEFVEPAFPTSSEMLGHNAGMTLRDYFAAKVNIEVYAPGNSLYLKLGRNPTVDELAALIAEVRFIEADAMIAVRSK